MKIASFIISMFALFGMFLSPALVSAQVDVLSPACSSSPDAEACATNTNQLPSGNSIYGRDGVLTKAANLIVMVVGVASVIVIMIGGFKYITSSGDPTSAKSAKDTIMFAVVGIIVAVFGELIVVFVLNRL